MSLGIGWKFAQGAGSRILGSVDQISSSSEKKFKNAIVCACVYRCLNLSVILDKHLSKARSVHKPPSMALLGCLD